MSSAKLPTIHRPLRLAVICDRLDMGGQETGLLEFLRFIDRRIFEPHVYCFRRGGMTGGVRRLGIPVTWARGSVRTSDKWSAADTRAKTKFRADLARAMRAARIDVCLIYAWADGIAAAREAGVPAIVERVDGPKLIGWVRDKSSCERVICESQAIRRLLVAQQEHLRCPPERVSVIPNGIDLERFDPDRYNRARARRALGLDPDDFVVGTLARLAPVKNLGHVLKAARLLMDRIGTGTKRPRFVIAGPDGGEGASLRREARALGLGRTVRFIGSYDDVAPLLRAFDVFVLTSFQEGLSFAALEAMAMGLPIIATQADSLVEVIRDNGYLVSPVDPLRTAIALRGLMSHPGLLKTLGQRSRQLARAFDIERMAKRYQEVLLAAARSGRRRTAPRRRIAVLPGHAPPRTARTANALEALFATLAKQRADVYWLGLAKDAGVPAWPPRRRQRYAATREGRRARIESLEWIRPDLIVTDCPRIVDLVRSRMPGEEIAFVPGADETCDAAGVVAAVDRLVALGPSERRSMAQRWPTWAWKIGEPGSLPVTPRPVVDRRRK